MTSRKSGSFITRLFQKKGSMDKAPTTASMTGPVKLVGKHTLYVFGGSVWASAPGLALMELNYAPGTVEERVVNLLEGENFTPEFIRINPAATLPTLVTPNKTYVSTAECVEWLVLNAPTPGVKSARQDVIAAVHRDYIDPNFSLLSARTQGELDAKRDSVPGQFIRQRQAKLEELAPKSPDDLKAWYKDKLEFNGFLSSVYAAGAPSDVTSKWFEKSNQHWSDVKTFIDLVLPSLLPASGFVDGAAPGEADFHVAAWLARTAGVCGAKIDDVTPLGEALGLTLDANIVAYFNAWKVRDSWKKMYAEGLH